MSGLERCIVFLKFVFFMVFVVESMNVFDFFGFIIEEVIYFKLVFLYFDLLKCCDGKW